MGDMNKRMKMAEVVLLAAVSSRSHLATLWALGKRVQSGLISDHFRLILSGLPCLSDYYVLLGTPSLSNSRASLASHSLVVAMRNESFLSVCWR